MAADPSLESRIRDCILKALNSPNSLSSSLQMGSTPGWDSMGHMMVVMELEREFAVRFPSHRLPDLVTVQSIARAIEAQRS
jgi:acyl carrier protein